MLSRKPEMGSRYNLKKYEWHKIYFLYKGHKKYGYDLISKGIALVDNFRNVTDRELG